MFKSVFVFAVLLVVEVLATPVDTRPVALGVVPDIIDQEEPCVVQGGSCIHRKHCDPKVIVRIADLCPKQSHVGVVCCYLQ